MIRCPRCIILWHFQWKTWTVDTTGIFYLMCYFLHSVQNKRKIYWNKWPFDKLKSSDRYPWSCELNNVFKSISAHIHSKILPWRTEGIFDSSISAILFKTGINWYKIGSNFYAIAININRFTQKPFPVVIRDFGSLANKDFWLDEKTIAIHTEDNRRHVTEVAEIQTRLAKRKENK